MFNFIISANREKYNHLSNYFSLLLSPAILYEIPWMHQTSSFQGALKSKEKILQGPALGTVMAFVTGCTSKHSGLTFKLMLVHKSCITPHCPLQFSARTGLTNLANDSSEIIDYRAFNPVNIQTRMLKTSFLRPFLLLLRMGHLSLITSFILQVYGYVLYPKLFLEMSIGLDLFSLIQKL